MMNNETVRRLGVSEPHPCLQVEENIPLFDRNIGSAPLPKPPFITDPVNSYSAEFQLECLAWWLMTTKSSDELTEYLAKQKKNSVVSLTPALAKCKAFIWLCQMSDQRIRDSLIHLEGTKDVEQIREHLNTLKPLFKVERQL